MKAGGIAARLRSVPTVGAVLAVLTVLGLVVPSAASAQASFSCRASAARISNLPGNLLGTIEPFVANKADKPCRADSEDLIVPTSIGGSLLTVNAINVATKVTDLVEAGGSSTVTNPTVNLGNGALVVHADVIDAVAGYACVKGAPMAETSGHVVNLVINGHAITIPPGINTKIPLGPLGSLTLNEVDTTSTTVTRRAIDLVTPLGTVVLSEATADLSGNPCASSSTLTKGTGRGHIVVTPKGAARLIASNRCVSNKFKATVVGREISKVSFTLDGRSDGTRTHSPFGVTIHPTPGHHTLKARVTFTSSSGTPPKTLTLRFKGCPGAHARIVITPKAAARLIAAHRCVRNSFNATVVGTEISQVVFSEDGAQLATRTSKPYRVTIQPTPGHHTLAARVTFKPASHAKPRTLRVGFTGCPAPNFTG